MAQLLLYVFYDVVLVSIFFAVLFVIFLKTLLPLLGFLSKYTNYLTFYLLKELSKEVYDIDFNGHLFNISSYCYVYFNVIYTTYYISVYENIMWYGLYLEELGHLSVLHNKKYDKK